MTDLKKIGSKKNVESSLTSINVVIESPNLKSKIVQEKTDSETTSKSEAKEYGGRGGLEPTRFGDWEKNGRCIDF